METRKIGSLDVSVVGLGCNNFGWRADAKASAAVIDAALDAGINFFDTADVYGGGRSEEFIGQVLDRTRRDRVVLATKFGMKMGDGLEGAKPAYLRRAVEDSLRRLRTDRIDLYQLHQPDKSTPIVDTLGALRDLVKAGKVREIGCSNFSAGQLREAGGGFVSVQNHYNLVHREPEAEVLPECVRSGIAFIPYFPLANGLLTGKYHPGQAFPQGSRASDSFGPKVFDGANLAKAGALAEYARAHGHTLLELAVSWLASKTAVASVIAGSKTAEQARTNATAAAWKLSLADFGEIDKILA